MNNSQKNDFRRMASRYQYIRNGDKLMRSVITKKKGFEHEREYTLHLQQGLVLCITGDKQLSD